MTSSGSKKKKIKKQINTRTFCQIESLKKYVQAVDL